MRYFSTIRTEQGLVLSLGNDVLLIPTMLIRHLFHPTVDIYPRAVPVLGEMVLFLHVWSRSTNTPIINRSTIGNAIIDTCRIITTKTPAFATTARKITEIITSMSHILIPQQWMFEKYIIPRSSCIQTLLILLIMRVSRRS